MILTSVNMSKRGKVNLFMFFVVFYFSRFFQHCPRMMRI